MTIYILYMSENLDFAQVAQRGVGNTKQPPRYRNWFITINNPNEDDRNALLHKIYSLAQVFAAQLEEGESRTPHFQAAFEFKSGKSFETIKKILPRAKIMKTNNRKAAIVYCTKPEGRLEGPWTKGLPKQIKLIETFRPFQSDILKLISDTPDDRTIHWFYDKTGSVGKTSFAKYLCVNYNALYCCGKCSDTKYLIAKHFEKDECNKDDLICIFGFTRTKEDYVSYEAIESVKDGIFTSTKYESTMVVFNSPHVFIFANFKPDKNALSKDRWSIKKINPSTYQIEDESDGEVCEDEMFI